jgi:hypothetical protein
VVCLNPPRSGLSGTEWVLYFVGGFFYLERNARPKALIEQKQNDESADLIHHHSHLLLCIPRACNGVFRNVC